MAWFFALIFEFYIHTLKRFVDFDGRSRRLEFWAFTITNMIVGSIFLAFDHLVGTYDPETPMGLFNSIYALLVFLPSLSVSVRRLHDVGYSGWMLLFALIPIVGWIWFIITAATEGQGYSNKYGPNPKKRAENKTQSQQPEQKPEAMESGNPLSLKKHQGFQCRKCNKNVSPDDSFCWNCGNEFRAPVCPNCKSQVSKRANYCSECGEKLMIQEM